MSMCALVYSCAKFNPRCDVANDYFWQLHLNKFQAAFWKLDALADSFDYVRVETIIKAINY
ncbi:hypothetical protein TYRP_022719 [Tyrophagus putrescentiae]|nr:hypothetical protein TYRP_022719 [Tyrophagus putrescentiae]